MRWENIAVRMLGRSEVINSSWIGHLRIGTGEVEIRDVVVTFPEPTEDIVSEADIKGEVALDAIVVLYIKAPVVVGLPRRMVCARA